MKRTCYCAEPLERDIGKEFVLQGWVDTRRDHGGVIFVDLRDRTGLLQVVFDPATSSPAHASAGTLRNEFVIEVRGTLRRRSEETVNPKLATGRIELLAQAIEVLNGAEPIPFAIGEDAHVTENVRLHYRYLDIRRPAMQRALKLRHEVCRITRECLDELGFLEVETPMLTRSTPEGARDYLVPSRVNPGQFFALPQSPQLFKQMLMVSGIDRYYQVARCFRDEDLRADRQPEFTQIDLEMSFVTADDVMAVVEGLLRRLFTELRGVGFEKPFPRMTYDEVMRRFGTDRPDTRFGLELCDLTDAFRQNLLDKEGPEALKECTRIADAIVVVGGNQDHLVGECRVAVKTLRQRAGLAMATNPGAAEVAKEIRERTQKMLRNPAVHEFPRH